MDENGHKKIYRQKRPKIRVRENTDNLDYYSSMTEENIELDKIKNLKMNNDLFLNNNNKKIERKRSVQSEKRSKKSLTDFQKKMKNLLTKFNSSSHKIKRMFHKWVYITFSQKKNNLDDDEDEEEEEEEIEKAKYDKNNKQKKNKFKKNNKNKNDSDEEEEEEEEEEEDEEKIKLMNDLNLNNLEEIEERPPNEEESAMTSIAAKARNPKNHLNVALRKIFKYKNTFYGYFTKWKKVINIPNILIILTYQKKFKNILRKLDGKRNLLILAMAFKNWKMKCEKLKTGEKKVKKKKKIIIYKKKNGEMERKEHLEDYNNLSSNKDDNDKLSIKKDGIKIKTVKKRIIKKKITSSKSKQSKMPTINNNIIINNNNITPIKQNHSFQDNTNNIHINKKESEKSESNMSFTSDNKNEIEKTGEENGTKKKKIVKKIKKIVKKVKKSKKDEKLDKTEKDKNNLPPLYISSDQVKILKPLNSTEKYGDNEKELSSISSNKAKVKKKIKKVNKINIKDSSNKSLDFLLEKEKGKGKENKNKMLSKSYNPNIESIKSTKIGEIIRDKSTPNNGSKDKIKIKKKKIIHKSKKKVKSNKNEEIKIEDNTNTNSEENTTDKMNNIIKRENSLKDSEENTQKNIISEQNVGEKEDSKKLTPTKITFITDDENKGEKRTSGVYHNLGKDSRIDLNAIVDSDLMDYSEDSSEEEIKKKKKSKKNKKKGEEISKDEINPDIINIEITQDDEESDNKSKKSKKKKKKIFTKEEKELIKIYKRAYHLLRRAIRSFKKRNKANEEFKQSLELNNYFIKWKNKFINKIDIPKLDNEEKEGNNNLEENKNEEEDISNNNNILEIKKEEQNNNESNEDINEDNNNFELHKNNIVNKLVELAQTNNKIQNETIDIIKNANEDTFKDIYLDEYIKLIETNNKNIYSYKILCLYVKYNKKFIDMKTSNPKKWYFNYWNKIIKK